MSESPLSLLENIDRLAFLCLSCSVEDRQKWLSQINDTVAELRRQELEKESES